jgi:hypothetical protein
MMTQSATVTRTAPAISQATAWPRLLTLFVLLALVLLAANWTVIHAVNIELGDFAANSLLIQDAKSLSLLKGNYSRVGFNHPGPAILYVLAFGELVFHDWLRLAPSPFSGQLTGVALYSAFWLTLMFAGLRKLIGSAVAAALALAVFAFAAALLDHQVFAGIWFPHLYFFPFAAMLVAAARFADGHADTLPTLAVASGFLVNGHVSFVAILGIILLTVLGASFVRARRPRGEAFLLGKPFLATHRRQLLAFLAIFALFLLPLLIETVLRFPGPLAEYAAFSGKNKPNSMAQAIQFVSVYWGGTRFPALLGIALTALLWAHVRADAHAIGRTVRGAIVVFCGATLALLFYAKFGVDMLDQSYIGLFYYAVPALVAALSVLCIWKALAPRRQAPVAFCLIVLLVAATVYLVRQPVIYLSQYNEPAVTQTYERLKTLPRNGRLVLDLDYAKDANFVWSRVLGIEAYGKRHNDQFLCLNQNWHISNTVSARCSEEEVARGPRYLVRMTEPGAPTPTAEGMGLSFYRAMPPDLATTPAVSVAAQRDWFKTQFLGSGWSDPEGEFVWSQGAEAILSLPLPGGFNGTLELDLGAFLPLPNSTQTVTIDSGAGSTGPQVFNAAQPRRKILVPVQAGARGAARIVIRIQHPQSPQQLGLSQDTRQLGVSLYGFRIEGK